MESLKTFLASSFIESNLLLPPKVYKYSAKNHQSKLKERQPWKR